MKPFLKFPGGKRGIIDELTSRVPSKYNRYFEPFVGGGALFFELAPKQAYISDVNQELILTYTAIRDDLKKLFRSLEMLPYDLDDLKKAEEFFYRLRKLDRKKQFKKLKSWQKAARTIYLNKTCFNGLYRVNSRGEFNAPFGKYEKPMIYSEANLKACSKALKGTEIVCCSYEQALTKPKKGDFVYMDPPYVPTSSTANFTAYSADGFGFEDHLSLVEACRKLDKRGVRFMLTNSNTKAARKLYKGFNIEAVVAGRAINCQSEGRKGSDIIVRNYS